MCVKLWVPFPVRIIRFSRERVGPVPNNFHVSRMEEFWFAAVFHEKERKPPKV